MTAVDDHLDQARRNLAFAQRLLSGRDPDATDVQWAVIAAFYCAVHCMQAHLTSLGHDPTNHAERGALIGMPSSNVPPDVRRSYFWLKQRSESARYRLGTFETDFVRDRVLDDHALRVARFVGIPDVHRREITTD